MAFRLKDDTKITPLPVPEKFVEEPLDVVLSQLENKYKFHLLNDAEGSNYYRLISMKRNNHSVDIIAYLPENTEKWIVVDAIETPQDL